MPWALASDAVTRLSNILSGVYIVQNTMARGGGMVLGKKMKNEAVGNKMKKKEKGERKKKKRKRGRVIFLLI